MALYTDDTIHRIIDGVNDKYFLPDIQRPFVWKQDQIYALFDSIMRGYPISTFLFWEVEKGYLKENKIKRFNFISNNKEENNEERNFSDRRDYYLVLDGQQRITTLFMALKGCYIERRKEKELFINIISGENENEDGLLYEFKFLDKNNKSFFKEDEKLWVNVKRVYECKDDEEKRILRNNIKTEADDEGIVEINIDRLHSRLRTEEILNYYNERENDYDKVLDIFVRTNSGGTKLTYSDLLFSTIKLRWKDARNNFKNLINDLNGEAFDFDTDFILKTCLVLFGESQKEIKYSKKNVGSDKIDKISNNWEKIVESMSLTRDLLQKFGITHTKLLTSNNALIPLVYFIYNKELKGFGDSNQKGLICPGNEKLMKSFLINSLLSGLFGGQSDSVLYSIKRELDSSTNSYFPLGQIKFTMKKRNKEIEIGEEFLEDIKYKDKNSYLVLNLIHPDTNFNVNTKSNLPEQDHLFSRKELKDEGYIDEEINTIFNIRYVASSSNKKKSSTPFKEWIETLSDEEKEKYRIPHGEWNVKNYKDFLKSRKELIMKDIRDSIKISV